ncbi:MULTISPECIES: Txe/YoeB family addiction module toxin [unclassified Selenomonas]|uniref:Txe/YoeB family addiction module toxin n=1 Tax=unclassified Selenomonas TaxID=2637378 RepID=UPI0008FFDABE|nr:MULTISPECIES: Txe/YoeB family addiction module toxin [unclassified Selenomonas]MBF1693819.1 Txe/YoeB family addiction module toxin [Selenomonas sp.]
MKLLWEERAWGDYLYWQMQDRKTLKRINDLLKDVQRNAYEGIGKPEPLRENLSGCWSRRIDETNRLVYRIEDGSLYILACRGHY